MTDEAFVALVDAIGITPYYQDRTTALFLADARDVLPRLPAASVDLILCDPPFGHNNNNGDLIDRWEQALGKAPNTISRPIANDGAEANELIRWAFGEFNRLLRPGCCCCCCCCGGGGPDPQFARWSLWLDEAIGFKQMVVWDKGGLGMGWHYRRSYETVLVGEKPGAACHWFGDESVSNIVHINKIIPQVDDHPTPKPVSLMAYFIRAHSTVGDLVVDSFLGGGPVALAARKLGRRCIGIELDRQWLDIAVNRLAQTVMTFDAEPVAVQTPSLFEVGL